jgi:hypothetical protein
MDDKDIAIVREIVKEELAKVYADRWVSNAPQCVYCGSTKTNWMGGNRMICRDCRRTKTIKVEK